MVSRRALVNAGCAILAVYGLYSLFTTCYRPPRMLASESSKYIYDRNKHAFRYDREMPLVFIGGVPRSGTTLMRALLDAHPDVRCGEETRVIPRILGMRGQWARSEKENKRLQEAGLTDKVLNDAVAAFILEVIAKHGEPAPRLCNKDPFTLKSSLYLSHLFPNSKFLLMIRDGRAVVNSIISRKVTISGFDLSNFKSCLNKWNQAMESMYYQCLKVGPYQCMPVYYEQLVLHPETWLQQILKFLDIPWDEAVLHHADYIDQPGGISLSKTERSTDQVVKPINMEALTSWVDSMPHELRDEIDQVAPMLQRLGYDPHSYPPSYGEPDSMVANNTWHVKHNAKYWSQRTARVVDNNSHSIHGNRTPDSLSKLAKSINVKEGLFLENDQLPNKSKSSEKRTKQKQTSKQRDDVPNDKVEAYSEEQFPVQN